MKTLTHLKVLEIWNNSIGQYYDKRDISLPRANKVQKKPPVGFLQCWMVKI